jgi:hypothetical protein
LRQSICFHEREVNRALQLLLLPDRAVQRGLKVLQDAITELVVSENNFHFFK